jgi:hypothetical protein
MRRSIIADLDLNAELHLRNASVLRLSAPAADSTTGISFGNAAVDASGRWKAKSTERSQDSVVRRADERGSRGPLIGGAGFLGFQDTVQ